MKNIPYGRQHITEEDINAVVEALKSDYLTQGPAVSEFENKFSDYVGSKYAVAVSNGTAALHLSALALGLKKGDRVITTPITFAASANCVLYCGGEIDFVDIDSESYTMDLDKLEEKLLNVPKGYYKGVIPVDFAGYPVNLERLRGIADRYGLWIIEDACHAPGAEFSDSNKVVQRCGNGEFSDTSIFSFHPVKHIATAEGGMITTNRRDLFEKLLILRTHGITKDISLLSENHGGWYYEMQTLGFNYRLTDIQAALGTSQLARANDGIQRRREIASSYNKAFEDIEAIVTPKVNPLFGHAYHLYVIQVDDRLGLYNYLKSKGVFAQVHYIPVHTLPFYREMGWDTGEFPVSESYYSKCLSLPMYPTLTQKEQNFVIKMVLDYLG